MSGSRVEGLKDIGVFEGGRFRMSGFRGFFGGSWG